MKNTNEKIIKHYSKSGLFNKILKAFKENGKTKDNISQDDLNALDEFHIGGIDSTRKILENIKITRSTKILDLGSGIGGPARYIRLSRCINWYHGPFLFKYCIEFIMLHFYMSI